MLHFEVHQENKGFMGTFKFQIAPAYGDIVVYFGHFYRVTQIEHLVQPVRSYDPTTRIVVREIEEEKEDTHAL